MKLVATNGLAPSIGRKASSTVRVPLEAPLELVDEVDVVGDDVLVNGELVELEPDVTDEPVCDCELDDEEVETVLGGAEELEELLVVTTDVVDVDFDVDNANAAAPAITIITTMTTAIITLLIAETFTTLFFMLKRNTLPREV